MLDFFNELNDLQERTKNRFVQTNKKPSKDIKEIYEIIINSLVGLTIESRKIWANTSFEYEKLEEKQRFEDMQKHIWVAGGSLSELFIKGYAEKPKDIDIFIDYNMFDFDENKKTTEMLLKILNNKFGTFEVKKKSEWESQNYDRTFKLESILSGTLTNFPEIEIELIFVNRYELQFDLSFREFYYNGDFIVATERALKDIKEKTITFNGVESPLSTLIRAKEFAKRYNYTIDEHSKKWITNYIKYFYEEKNKLSIEKLKNDFSKIEKYKSNFNVEQLIIDLEKIELTEQEKKIVDKIWYETYEMDVKFFRNTVERIRLIEEKKIDMNKIYELTLPQLSSNVKKYIDSITQKETSKEIIEQITKKINHLDKALEIKKIFLTEDEKEEMIQGKKFELANEIQRNFNVKAFRNDEIEAFYVVMEETIKAGKLNVKDPFFENQTEANWTYFGLVETIENCILSNKIYLKPTLEEYLFKNNNEGNGIEIEFKYNNSEKERIKKFNYNKETKNIFVSGDYYGYLINERREFLLNVLDKGVESHPYENEKTITKWPINKATNDINFKEKFLPNEAIQIIENEYQKYKEEKDERELKWRQSAIKRMNMTSPPIANNGKTQVLPDITEEDLPF